MEETGHYYTVYLTSLAVGYKDDVAYQQAVLAQMPDEVGYLDAANLHKAEAFGNKEYNLKGTLTSVPNDWRFKIETVLHALGDSGLQDMDVATSKYQRDLTKRMLLKQSPVSLNFGLLLHRLGDSFAHSVIGNEDKMYVVGPNVYRPDHSGHLRHIHDPDYPFLRPKLFHDYLELLYSVLHQKLYEKRSVKIKNKIVNYDNLLYKGSHTSKDIAALKKIFQDIFDKAPKAYGRRVLNNDEEIRNFMAEEIRKAGKSILGREMRSYAPEKIEKQTLAQFLNGHPELVKIGVNERMITQALDDMYSKVNSCWE